MTTVGGVDELDKQIEDVAMAPFRQLMLRKVGLSWREKGDYFIAEREYSRTQGW